MQGVALWQKFEKTSGYSLGYSLSVGQNRLNSILIAGNYADHQARFGCHVSERLCGWHYLAWIAFAVLGMYHYIPGDQSPAGTNYRALSLF